MLATIVLVSLLLALLATARRRPPPPQPRHVSFSLVRPPVQRRWSSPFHKRRSSAPDSPRNTPPCGVHSSQNSARRLSTPLRLSLAGRRRSSGTSYTSTPDHLDTRAPSPPSSTQSSAPRHRTRFVNPFSKHFRSRTLSPPSTFKSPDVSSVPSSPPARRRTLINKVKSIFKSIPPEPFPPSVDSKPVFMTINARLRRKPVARTEPYGPPWNAPMPVPDSTPFHHSLQRTTPTTPPLPHSSRRRSVHEYPRPGKVSMSPGQLSPRTFINELDQRLSLLQQQRAQDPIPLPP